MNQDATRKQITGVEIATGYELKGRASNTRRGEDFMFFRAHKTALRPTQSLIQ
jgi:hypothetical protein